MKLNKIIITLVLTVMLFAQISFIQLKNVVQAANEKSFDTTITSANADVNLQNLKPGDQFDVNFAINNFQNIQKGLYAIIGRLEYNKDILEIVPVNGKMITTTNGWEETSENEKNLKFITTGSTENKEGIKEGIIGTIKLRVKNTLTGNTQTSFKIKEIQAGDGETGISSADAELNVKVVVSENIPDNIESNVYTIDKVEHLISKVEPNTTVENFKQNVVSHGELVFTDKDGNALTDDSIIGTGTKLQVGTSEELNFTIVVRADIDGNGTVTPNDLVLMKLHIIGKEILTGINEKAADVDINGNVTINDVAQLKLIIIGL